MTNENVAPIRDDDVVLLEEEQEITEENIESDNENDQEFDDAEAKAREKGWVPKEEFFGDQENHMDADTFLKKRDDKMSRLSDETNELKQTVRELKDFYKNSEEKAYQRALKELEAKKNIAKEEGDIDELDRVYQQQQELAKDYTNPVQQPQQQAPPQLTSEEQDTADRWIFDNPWYSQDYDMQKQAKEICGNIPSHVPIADNLQQVEREMRRRYPSKFKNLRRAQPTRVQGSSVNGGIRPNTPQKRTLADLPKDAQEAYEKFKRAGAYKRDDSEVQEYIKEYLS